MTTRSGFYWARIGQCGTGASINLSSEGYEKTPPDVVAIKITGRTIFSPSMQEAKKRDSVWRLLAGVALAEMGMLLIAFGGWYALKAEARIIIYVGGGLLFLSGLLAIRIDAMEWPAVSQTSLLQAQGKYLGNFRLNGYSLRAYERQTTGGGKEFHLVSFPSMGHLREAAFVRYLIQEGLIEDLWPKMSRQIKEEARWAFLS